MTNFICRRQTSQVMMTTVKTKSDMAREAAFSLRNLLTHYLDSPEVERPFSPTDLAFHRICRIERFHWLTTRIKLSMEQRYQMAL